MAAFCTFALAKSQNTCSHAQAKAAEDVVATASSWDDLYRMFLRYRHCDDGAIAEGFSESVTRLLENHWREKKKIESLIKKNIDFQVFIIRHVNATSPPERLKQIAKNAQESCSKELKMFCDEIVKAIVDAEKDMPPLKP